MRELTAAGLKFCIALMGVSNPTEYDCSMAWMRAAQARHACGYLATAPEPFDPHKWMLRDCPPMTCFHYYNHRTFDGGWGKTYLCEPQLKPPEEGPPVS